MSLCTQLFFGLQYYQRPRSVKRIGGARFLSPWIIMRRPRRFSLSAGSRLRLVRSQYLKAAPTKMGHISTKKWRTVRCCDLNNAYYFNVPLRVARLYGWLESPLIVSRLFVTLGTASFLEKFDLDAV